MFLIYRSNYFNKRQSIECFHLYICLFFFYSFQCEFSLVLYDLVNNLFFLPHSSWCNYWSKIYVLTCKHFVFWFRFSWLQRQRQSIVGHQLIKMHYLFNFNLKCLTMNFIVQPTFNSNSRKCILSLLTSIQFDKYYIIHAYHLYYMCLWLYLILSEHKVNLRTMPHCMYTFSFCHWLISLFLFI